MEKDALHLLINEEIYLIDEVSNNVTSDESEHPIKTIPMAFVHSSTATDEIELLNKIIQACSLDPNSFKIVGINESVNFKKAIIFDDTEAVYYEPLNRGNGKVLVSKSLATLKASKEEKGKLWAAMKSFLS